MDSDALVTFLTVHRRGGISSAAKAAAPLAAGDLAAHALLEQELRRAAVRADRQGVRC
jgi:hypothetical protein